MNSTDDFVLQFLVDKGVIDNSASNDIRSKLENFAADGDKGDIQPKLEGLIDALGTSPMKVSKLLADEFGMDAVDLSEVRASSDALKVLSYDLAFKYRVFPLEVDETEIQIAISDPLDMDSIDTISHVLKRSVFCRLAPQSAILNSIL